MIYESLIVIIEQNIESLSINWFKALKNSAYMQTYNALTDPEIMRRGKSLFNNLHAWLNRGAAGDEVEDFFLSIGSTRLKEGFPLSEVNYALFLEKKTMIEMITGKKEITESLNSDEIVDIMSILNSYFDLGLFYITRGYLSELYNDLESNACKCDGNFSEYLKKSTLFPESGRKTEGVNYGRKFSE